MTGYSACRPLTAEDSINTLVQQFDGLVFFSVFAFIWGALWGSFLNVVIHRLPRGLSVAHPPSHCPVCKTPIRWYDNIPLLSFVLLKGRCRSCRTRIPWRYPAVEALTAILSLFLFVKCAHGRLDATGWPVILVPFAFYFYFICVAIAISAIDLIWTLIPDWLTLPTALMGLVASVVIPRGGVLEGFEPSVTWVESLIGAATGGLLFLGISQGYRRATGHIGMGGGDVTMALMIGSFLGWRALIFVLFFASFQGLVVAIASSLLERVRGGRGKLLLRGVHRPEFWEQPRVGSQEPVDEHTLEPSDPADESGGVEPDRTSHATEATAWQTRSEAGELETIDPDSVSTPADPAAQHPEVPFGKIGIPFGPFLALASVEYVFIGQWVERWLMGGL